MLHLPAKLSAGIKIAALFHDVGKIHISDELLQKPSDLTRREFEEMKKHCAHGASMLLHIEPLREVALMVFHHHERWAGADFEDEPLISESGCSYSPYKTSCR